ncbi:MAG TPA: hypothetical protein VGC95_02915 [Chitinophagaceae bacterium]
MQSYASRQRELLNQLINFSWTILCFLPVISFWWQLGPNACLWIFIGIAIIFGLLPRKLLHRFQFSHRKQFYEKLGVKLVRRVVQNGDLVNSSPGHRRTIRSHETARVYLNTIAMYERFHWLCLVFFSLTMIYAICVADVWLALAILVANVVYNFCPLLLQQYNRIRIERVLQLGVSRNELPSNCSPAS